MREILGPPGPRRVMRPPVTQARVGEAPVRVKLAVTAGDGISPHLSRSPRGRAKCPSRAAIYTLQFPVDSPTQCGVEGNTQGEKCAVTPNMSSKRRRTT